MAPPSPAPATRRAHLAALAVPAAVVAGYVAFHGGLLAGLDLRDLPGPAGVVLVDELMGREQGLSWAGRLGAPLAWLLGPVAAARALASLAGLAGVIGVALAAGALTSAVGPRGGTGDRGRGRRAALLGGMLAIAWTPAAAGAWMLGYGGVALGIGWFGAGLAWHGAVAGRAGRAALGTAVLGLAIAIKPTAAPLAVLLLPAPWFAPADAEGGPGPRWTAAWMVGAAALAAAVAWLAWPEGEVYLGAAPAGAEADAGPLSGLVRGLRTLAGLPARGLRDGALRWLAGGALLAAATLAVPSDRRGRARLAAVGVAQLLALLGALAVLGDAVQPRYLAPAALGLLALAGAGLASLAGARALRGGGWALALAVIALAALDTLAYARAWSGLREHHLAIEPCALPRTPAPFARRHAALDARVFQQSSLAGALELMQRAGDGPAAGVVIVPLKDRRELHARVAAGRAGIPFGRLDRGACCEPDQAPAPCAATTLDAAWDSGALLILPRQAEAVAPEDRAWLAALRADAAPRGRERRGAGGGSSRWWSTWRTRDRGGPLPCPVAPRTEPEAPAPR